MVYPSKRQKLGGDPPEMGRIHKRDVRKILPRQDAAVVDVTVQVTASLIISVDVDANGVPTATTTLTPGAALSSSSSPALTPAPAIFTTGSSSAAAAASLAPASSITSTGSISGTSPTPIGFSSLSSAGNSTSSISASHSGPLPAIISAITGNNTTASVAGTSSGSSRSSSSSSLSPSSSSSLSLDSSSLSSSSSSFPSSTALSSSGSGSGFSVPTAAIAGGVPGASGSAATDIPNGARNGTTKPNNDNSTSPPVVAGAVVGSVGGMAVILLVLVLVARWWKHHSRNSRYEDNADSTLHLNGTDGTVPTSRRSFLAAAGWLNRLSGTHHNRSSSPTLPPVTENERGFQKIAGRKLPSQFPTGTEEGPMARDFGALPPMPAPRPAHMSDTSSYYRDSRDTTHFFGSTPQTAPLFAGATSDSPPHERRRADPTHLGPETSPFDDSHSETLMPSPARTPHIHQHPGQQYFNHNQPPHSSWPSPEDAIQPAPRR